MALRRKIRGGMVIVKRGFYKDFDIRVKNQLARLAFDHGENGFRISSGRTNLFAIYAEDADSGRIIGWINWYKGDTGPEHGYYHLIRSFFVKESYRRRGVGDVLFREHLRYDENKPENLGNARAYSHVDAPEFFRYELGEQS